MGQGRRSEFSYWRVDSIVADAARQGAICEWTGIKPGLGVVLRGADAYEFEHTVECRITEIRVYYATPWDANRQVHELGDFPYRERGWTADAQIQVPHEEPPTRGGMVAGT